MTKPQPFDIANLKQGQIIKIFFKEGYGRPTNGQRYRFLNVGGSAEMMKAHTKEDGYAYDGFTIIAQAVDLDYGNIINENGVIPEIIFPHTLKYIELDDEKKERG